MSESINFIVRKSGKREDCYYIDSQGYYKITDISKITGIEIPALQELYKTYSTEYSEDLDVYYFSSIEKAKGLINLITKKSVSKENGRLVFLTEKEIEYIRLALIKEGSDTIHMKNSVKDRIFEKLNA